MPGLDVVGVYAYMTYGGVLQDSPAFAGRMEGEMIVDLAKRLSAAGLHMEIVAGGSTPTGRYVAAVPGITEIQPGEYPFYDVKAGKYGISHSKCAASVLTTVVSSSPERVVVDGGSKAFATDIASGMPPHQLRGYGLVMGHEEELVLEKLSEEHGIIVSGNGRPLDIPIGTRLRIIPNHVCPCIALHSYAYLLYEDHYEKERILGRGMLE